MEKVLVAGGTGYLGGFVVQAFKRRGYFVRALARNPDKLAPIRDCVDEVFVGEVTQPSSLSGICDGVGMVFSSVGITTQRDGLKYVDVDYQGNKNLLDEAVKGGVRRFGYAHAINAEALLDMAMIRAKQDFVEVLLAAPIEATVVRPSGFFSDMRAFLEMAKKGWAFLPGDGHWHINPIHGADLAEVCVDAMERGEADLSVGGPDTFTYEEITRLAFAAVGKSPRITHVPAGLVRGVARFLRAVASDSIAGPVEFVAHVLTSDMVGERRGTHHLADFYKEEMTAAA